MLIPMSHPLPSNVRPLIAANWKMHKLLTEAQNWAEDFLVALEQQGNDAVDLAICAPFIQLASLNLVLQEGGVALGAQDLSPHGQGAHTGDISADMLCDVGVHYVIVGHSERRSHHQEGDESVRLKVQAALAAGLCPILCVGESLAEREAGQALDVSLGQLKAALADVELQQADALVVAYEPVWAIGTGKTASSADAQEMCAAIRQELRGLYPTLADEMRILYGGSMKANNAAELLAQEDINGGLVGSASLDIDSMLAMIGAISSA